MGRLALAVLLSLAVAAAGVEAQGPGGRGGGGGQGAMMMTADLVDAALAPIREELGALRAGAGRGGPGGRGGAGGPPQGGDRGAVMATLQRAQELTAPHRVRYEEITTAAQREALLPLLRRPPGGR